MSHINSLQPCIQEGFLISVCARHNITTHDRILLTDTCMLTCVSISAVCPGEADCDR